MWGISFANLNMLLATIPAFEPEKPGEKKEDVQEVDSIADIFKD